MSHLQCSYCGKEYQADTIIQVCDTCGFPLFVRYDLPSMKKSVDRSVLTDRPANFWRYHELLPVHHPENIVSLNEVMTPIVGLSETAASMNMENLYAKDEGVLPSGTFKARGASIGISKAKEMGVRALGIPTNGNAGAAWSLYAARAGIDITVVMPKSAPITPQKECLIAGADLYVIDGTIADAGKTLPQLVKSKTWYDVSTLKEPYRLEGKKTMGFEIAEQFDWSIPDVIVYPTGGGAGVIGIYKALSELQELGWLERRMPRFVIVQASGCAPLVRAFENGDRTSVEWQDPHTIAFGMRVPKAFGDFLILDVLRNTDGIAISVDDEQIHAERQSVVRKDGLHTSPEGAAGIAGVRKLREQGWIRPDETVLVMNTGSGLKYTDQITAAPKTFAFQGDLL
jgi:threonine synthase